MLLDAEFTHAYDLTVTPELLYSNFPGRLNILMLMNALLCENKTVKNVKITGSVKVLFNFLTNVSCFSYQIGSFICVINDFHAMSFKMYYSFVVLPSSSINEPVDKSVAKPQHRLRNRTV